MSKIIGQLIYIYPEVSAPLKSGEGTFVKRDFVIAVQRFDPDTGEPTIDTDNTPMFTLFGADRVHQLDALKIGDIVSITYFLRGRKYRDSEGKERLATDIYVQSVTPAHGQPKPVAANPQPQAMPQQQPVAQPVSDGLPF